jgi:hypothetical protein
MVKVVNKEFFTNPTKVVDIQVENKHNFAIGIDKVIVHNSHIRPRGSFIHGIGVESPGAVKYMELYDKVSEIITSGSGKKSTNKKAKGKIRKGAMMAVLDCLSKGTLINTIDGLIPIEKLVGKKPYLYSTDGFGVVFIKQAQLVWSKGIKKLVRVWFGSKGEYIDCTPNHKFMLVDGTFKEAIELNEGDPLTSYNYDTTIFCQSSALFSKVHKVENLEKKREVFDIAMPSPYHNFCANGVFVHNCSHPDIIEFITAKQQQGRLTKFNMSVNCSDEFMERVIATENGEMDSDNWDLIFPETTHERYKEDWDGNIHNWKQKGYPIKIYNTVSVKWLWNLIMESTYNRAEPGILFLDRANEYNPLYYGEQIAATNPCLRGDVLISTTSNDITIKDLIKRFQNGELFQIPTFNIETNEIEIETVTNAFLTSPDKEIIELIFDNGKILHVTPDHKIYTTNRGFVEAQFLTENDEFKII